MASKGKSSTPKSNIDPAQVKAMQEQQRLADEARAREQALIQQQTDQQQEQFNGMLSVYQQQVAALNESRSAQQKYLDELTRQQDEQAKDVAQQQQRQQSIAQLQQAENIKKASRTYSLLSERRGVAQNRRTGIFNVSNLPSGFQINRGIMG